MKNKQPLRVLYFAPTDADEIHAIFYNSATECGVWVASDTAEPKLVWYMTNSPKEEVFYQIMRERYPDNLEWDTGEQP